jgi:putative inorganic carbon (hco3(-)) transporter
MPLPDNRGSHSIRKIATPHLRIEGLVARTRLFDRILTSVLVALIVFTPFAIGSVHRWAFTLMEVAVFGLLILWSIRVRFQVQPFQEPVTKIRDISSRSLVPPAAILAVLIVLQLVPLPPILLRFLSPSTYHVFVHALPGWPQAAPYARDFGFADNWRALAIAPSLSETALLKYATYMGLFFLILAYPFADDVAGESRFHRAVIATVVLTGLSVTVIGLAERVYWNGKILWFVIPQDWGAPWSGAFPRATGPFVNPDHFASYLAMVFPLVLTGAFRGLPSVSTQQSIPFRLIAGLAALLIFLAIALSQSRSAWIGAAAAIVFLTLISFDSWSEASKVRNQFRFLRFSHGSTRIAPRSWPSHNGAPQHFLLKGSKTAAVSISLMVLLALVLLTLFTMGPAGRMQTGLRVGDTIGGGDIASRATVWKDTARMIRDFPFFGVGFGGWPEIFPRYQSAPWSRFYFRQAHNDYLQFAAETGLVGLVALVWFCSLVVVKSLRALRHFSAAERALFIALWLSVIAMALHESVDFCLRIPADAFLFTLLLALAVRMAMSNTKGAQSDLIRSPFARSGLLVASAVLIVLALGQQGLSYPYDVELPTTLALARGQVIAHPASGDAHLEVLRLNGQRMRLADRLVELQAAVFVSPNNPYLRDAYAQSLAMAGEPAAALDQVTQSVFNSPEFETHFYLTKRITLLSVPERHAVEQGFKEAVAAHYPGAVEGLGAFDEVFSKFSDATQLFVDAAGSAKSATERSRYLVAAGVAESRAGRDKAAENLFRLAIKAAPFDQDPYRQLISSIYGPRKDWPRAQAVIEEGVIKGVDPLQLELALSAAAQANGNVPLAESALLKALAFRPTYEMYIKVGRFYLESKRLDQAVATLQNATELSPASAEGFFWLATAQEGNYQYSAADTSYARAASLSPLQYRSAYALFHRRIDSAK